MVNGMAGVGSDGLTGGMIGATGTLTAAPAVTAELSADLPAGAGEAPGAAVPAGGDNATGPAVGGLALVVELDEEELDVVCETVHPGVRVIPLRTAKPRKVPAVRTTNVAHRALLLPLRDSDW
jgi:hypothetical protein